MSEACNELSDPSHFADCQLCIAMHCIVLHCFAMHCIALFCIVLHCIALYCFELFCWYLIVAFTASNVVFIVSASRIKMYYVIVVKVTHHIFPHASYASVAIAIDCLMHIEICVVMTIDPSSRATLIGCLWTLQHIFNKTYGACVVHHWVSTVKFPKCWE